MLRSAETAAKREGALLNIKASARMRHLQRAVLAEAVFDFSSSREDGTCIVVTRVAEPVLATAVEQGNRAAIHALPVNVFGSMTFHANVGANAHFLDQAGSTYEILPPRRVFHAQLLLAVDQPTKVGLLTPRALKEAHLSLCERHEVVEVKVTGCGDSWVFVQAFLLADLHGLDLNVASENLKLLKLVVDLVDMLDVERLLAVGTAHEGEGDPQGAPLVLEQLKYAIRVKNVSTTKLHAWLLL